jgi:TIR domain
VVDRRREVAGHAFISYVREDADRVDKLQRILTRAGIPVWRDTVGLLPGQDWRAEIRRAITNNAFVFIACFSRNSIAREVSYQNKELILAVDHLLSRRPDAPWLIPVRFDDCDIPDLELGGSRTLRSIQCADLFGEGYVNAGKRLVEAVKQIYDQKSDRHRMPEPVASAGYGSEQAATRASTVPARRNMARKVPIEAVSSRALDGPATVGQPAGAAIRPTSDAWRTSKAGPAGESLTHVADAILADFRRLSVAERGARLPGIAARRPIEEIALLIGGLRGLNDHVNAARLRSLIARRPAADQMSLARRLRYMPGLEADAAQLLLELARRESVTVASAPSARRSVPELVSLAGVLRDVPGGDADAAELLRELVEMDPAGALSALRSQQHAAEAARVLRLVEQKPVAEVLTIAELIRKDQAVRSDYRQLISSLAGRSPAETARGIASLRARLRHQEAEKVIKIAARRPAREVNYIAASLEGAGHNSDAKQLRLLAARRS